jgi:hypothetical protein
MRIFGIGVIALLLSTMCTTNLASALAGGDNGEKVYYHVHWEQHIKTLYHDKWVYCSQDCYTLEQLNWLLNILLGLQIKYPDCIRNVGYERIPGVPPIGPAYKV